MNIYEIVEQREKEIEEEKKRARARLAEVIRLKKQRVNQKKKP